MSETPFFFLSGSHRLFGVVHRADGGTRTPIVFCHPFGEEKLWTHRVLVAFARVLASKGHMVLRFDYAGNGDSEGEFSLSSLRTCLADIGVAIETLKQTAGTSRVALLGLRLGASLASYTAEARDDVETLILWAPIVDGARYAQELLRINLTTQMAAYREIRSDRAALAVALSRGRTVNVDGYELSPAMWEDLNGLALNAAAKKFGGPCLIAQLERAAAGRPAADLEALRRTYARADLRVVQEEPFWKEIPRFYETAPNLFNTTVAWIEPR